MRTVAAIRTLSIEPMKPSEPAGYPSTSEANPPKKGERVIRQYVVKYMSDRLDRLPEEDGSADIGLPESKGKSEVFYLFYPSGKKTVLRSFEKRSQIQRYATNLRYCQGKDLPIPRLIRLDDGRATWGLYRHWFIEEEYIEGIPFAKSEQNTEQIKAALTALARLHGETSAQWGRLTSPRKHPYKKYLEGRINKLFQELGLYTDRPNWGELGMWHGWFGLQLEQLNEPDRFSLIHENISPHNILLAPDGKAVFTGNGRLRFGIFVRDLERMLEMLAQDDENKRKDYFDLYMQAQNHLATIPDYENDFRFFRAAYYLQRYRSIMKRKSKGRHVPDEKIAAIRAKIRSFVW